MDELANMTTSDTGFELDEERVIVLLICIFVIVFHFVKRKLHIIEWNHLDLWKFYPMALASSWTVRGLLYPMSVVKSRLQLQRQNNVYTGMFNAFSSIVKTEGFTALYRVGSGIGFEENFLRILILTSLFRDSGLQCPR